MTLDTSELRSAISKLEDDVARLRRIADAAEPRSAPGTDLAAAGLTPPPDVVVRNPGEIVRYLGKHPELTGLVHDLAIALVEEFRGERSEIELALYQDPEIDDRELTLYLRLLAYDGSLMPRLDALVAPFDERFTHASDMVLVTTDHQPIE